MNFITDAEQLRKIPLFAQLDAGKLKRLAFASEESSFDAGDIIFTMNSGSDSVYVIMSGEVGVFVSEDASGDPVAVLSTSDVVGEMGVIANQPRSATLRAETEVRCLSILADDFMDLMRDNPEVSLSVLRQVVDRPTLTTQAFEALKGEHTAPSSPQAS
jgi:CRP-like cAMP-binding protein